jgi:DNA-3-methyladenine glycosylase II
MKLSEAEIELGKLDVRMATLIERNGHVERDSREGFFPSLARTIVGQQISVKAAASILGRFVEATDMDPVRTAALSEEQARTIGLSGQKYRYIHDLAQHFVDDSMVFDHLDTLSDDEVISELTKVKGIGIWSAQMFLMFTLARPDVFAPDDRGLQLAVQKLYGLPDVPKRDQLIELASKWAPYRTVASYHLWHSLNNEPV